MASQKISHYRVISKLGAGGMGEVYLAEDTRLDRRVALKLLPAEFTKDEDRVRRFVQEAKAASALNHPNIITIYDVGQQSDIHFIATELIEGETLRQRVRQTRLRISEALEIAIQIACALSAAHHAGIIHRDIKPENIMIRADGYVKVLDFGLAKLTAQQSLTGDTSAPTRAKLDTAKGVLLGTIKYMSPEQARGQSADPRSDIFSLAVVLFEMVTGRVPFDGETPSDVIASLLKAEPASLAQYLPEAPVELQRILAKSFRKDREERYQTMKDLLIDLKSLKEEIEVQTRLSPASLSGLSGTSNITAGGRQMTPVEQTPSTAVLPFVNMTADPENEYFCDGLAEEIINALSKVEGLRVAARTSAFSFKGKDLDIREIGHKLNVNTILEGSVRKAGGRLRITAQLVNIADGYHLWSEKYDRPIVDVFDIQDEISLAIVEALKMRLLGEEAAEVLKRHTVDVEAYQLYLKGRYFWGKRTEEGLIKAVEYFNSAIERDNKYALAFGGLADCYTVLSMYGIVAPDETYPASKAAVMRALEIDDQLAEAHASLAYVLYRYDWDWAAAEREFKRSIGLNPSYAPARQWYASYLSAAGRTGDALVQIRHAQELDPLSLIINRDVGMILYWARQYDQAIEELNKTLQMDRGFGPAYAFLGLAYEQRGMYEQALAAHQEGLSILPNEPFYMAQLGRAYALMGQAGPAQDVLGQLKELSKRRYVSPSYSAIVCVALGNVDLAFEWLEKAYQERDDRLVFIKVDPLSDRLRSDPRFEELLRRIGLQP